MIRLALPTGDLRSGTAALLDAAGAGIPDYAAGSRALRFAMLEGAGIARVFREKDIPVQVALGNYDVGICGLAWVEELTRRFPGHDVVRVARLGFGEQALWLAAAGDTCGVAGAYRRASTRTSPMRSRGACGSAAIVCSTVQGAAEAYPPEDADVALIAAGSADEVEAHGLRPIARVFESGAWLIANARSLATKDSLALLTQARARRCGERPRRQR